MRYAHKYLRALFSIVLKPFTYRSQGISSQEDEQEFDDMA